MLDEQDHGKREGPVAEDGEQVVDDVLEHVAAAVGERESRGREERAPHEARDGDEVLA